MSPKCRGISPVIDLEGRDCADPLMGCRVVCEGNPGREVRPARVVLIRQETEAAVPKPPPDFNGGVSSCVVAKRGRCFDVGSLRQKLEGFREKLGGVVRMQNVWRPEGKDNPIQERLQPR